MSIKIQKTFEAFFELEEIQGILREAVPTGLNAEEEEAFQEKITELKAIIADLSSSLFFVKRPDVPLIIEIAVR